jgi:Bacterial Ig domain
MQAKGRMVRLALALVLACGAVLVGATASAARSAPAQPGATPTLELTPARAVAQVDQPIQYTAVEVDAKGGHTDLTSNTNFRITDAAGHPAPCSQAKGEDKAGQVTCEKPGLYQVRGEVDVPRLDSGPAELEVVPEPVPPAIRSADRNPTSPARDVVVIGTTGTCSSTGHLRLEEIERSSVAVAGEFTAKLPIPPGTFPGDYHLLLSVPCKGMDDTRLTLVVENRPPKPAGDGASTLPGKQVTIDVTKNDKDPDDPDGYGTTVRKARPGPLRGSIEVRGEAIIYTPGEGFDRRGDRFAYAWCDIVGPDDQTACGTAMVTVAREPPRPANDEISTERDVDVLVPVTRNDEFPDNDALHVSQPPKEPGAEAVVDVDHPGNIRYKPARGFTGTDTFQYDYCPVVVTAAAPPTCPSATVTVTVVEPRVDPRIVLVDPEASPPNRGVLVKGTTGTCDKAARLTMDGAPQAAAPVPVTAGRDGGFEARLQIPPGTFVGSYELLLHAVCDGKPVVVGHGLKVDNQPPNAENDRQAVDATPGQPQPIDVLTNDTDPDDPDGYKTHVAVETHPAHGTAKAQGDQTIDYTPGREFVDVGEDRFTYRYCDVVGPDDRTDCTTATVIVTKKPPEAVDDPGIVTVQDQPVTIRVMANDRNAGKLDIPKLRVLDDPAPLGEAEPQPDGTIEYRPGAGFTDRDSFRYDYCGGPSVAAAQPCRPATVTVDVRPPPRIKTVVANPTPPNREVEVTGTTGSCSQAGRLILHIPSPGSDVAVPVTGAFTGRLRVPGGTFVGDYRLELQVDCQGKLQSDEETLEVANKPPDAVDDPASTPEGTPVTIPVADNDTDPDGDDGYQTTLEAAQPASGRTAVQPGNRVLYTPNARASGEDRFTYTVCDIVDAAGKKDCDTATVTVAVAAGPLISSVEPASTPPGKPVKVSGNTGSCNHAGTLALQGTGVTVAVTGGQDGAFTTSLTVPAGTFPGPRTLELRVDCKGQPQRAEKVLTVTNKAPVAADDDASTTRDQPVKIRVTRNDHDPDDPDGYRSAVLVTRQPDHGTAEPQPDLTVVYTPQRGFVGTDRFTYNLCDDVLNAAGRADCGDATVTVTVRGTGTAVAPAISSVEPGSTSPGKPVEVAGNTGSCGRAGTLTLSGAAGLRMGVAGDQDGRFAVTITVPDGTFPGPSKLALDVDCKGQVQRAEADLMVTNQAPVAADDQATTAPDTATTIEVTGNDRDPDDPDTYPTIVVVTGPPDQGTAEARPDLSIVYTPGPGFVGTDRFTYSLCDDVLNATGQADCGTATVTVRVDPIACAPSAGDISSLLVEPGRGQDGTRVRITAAVDPRLATCQLRLLLGGTPLAPDVTVGDDGSISAERAVPPGLKPGRNPMQLATLTAATLAEAPFEVVGPPPPARPPLPPWLVRLLLSVGALGAGFLVRAAFGKWGKSAGDRGKQRGRSVERPDDLRAEPHTSPVEVAVEPVPDNTRTLAVRLEPHPDPGIQTVQTLKEVTP